MVTSYLSGENKETLNVSVSRDTSRNQFVVKTIEDSDELVHDLQIAIEVVLQHRNMLEDLEAVRKKYGR